VEETILDLFRYDGKEHVLVGGARCKDPWLSLRMRNPFYNLSFCNDPKGPQEFRNEFEVVLARELI